MFGLEDNVNRRQTSTRHPLWAQAHKQPVTVWIKRLPLQEERVIPFNTEEGDFPEEPWPDWLS